MILTEKNLQEWKKELSKQMMEQYAVSNYGDTQNDKYWIKDHLGDGIQDVIDGEVECWDEK